MSWINDRVLILDDNIARHRLFRVIYGPREALHVHSIELLNAMLDNVEADKDPFSVVFLDHDLTLTHYGDGPHDAECGCAAVRALVTFYAARPKKPKVVIHSRNVTAAHLMMLELGQAGFTDVVYMPFE